MSELAQRLAERSPVPIPPELESAWAWMESQGWATETVGRYYLTPYAGPSVLGVVFTDEATLDGWLPDDPDAAREMQAALLPFAQTAGDGSLAALWRESDKTRVVGLQSEGEAFVLAESPVEFLRLCAIGYDELIDLNFGAEPEGPESVAAVSDFRAWVETTYENTVPDEWPEVGADRFTDWIGGHLGWEAEEPEPVPVGLPEDALQGEIRIFLNALGQPDGLDRITAHFELPDKKAKTLRAFGLEAGHKRKLLDHVFISFGQSPVGGIYPRPELLITGISADTSQEEVVVLLGEPELRGKIGPDGKERWLRFIVGTRYLHLEYDDGRIQMVTVMATG